MIEGGRRGAGGGNDGGWRNRKELDSTATTLFRTSAQIVIQPAVSLKTKIDILVF